MKGELGKVATTLYPLEAFAEEYGDENDEVNDLLEEDEGDLLEYGDDGEGLGKYLDDSVVLLIPDIPDAPDTCDTPDPDVLGIKDVVEEIGISLTLADDILLIVLIGDNIEEGASEDILKAFADDTCDTCPILLPYLIEAPIGSLYNLDTSYIGLILLRVLEVLPSILLIDLSAALIHS